MKRLRGLLTYGLVIGGAALLFTSCLKTQDSGPTIPTAGLAVYNLAPDNSAALFTLSGNRLNQMPILFPAYTGGYVNIFTGSRPLQVLDYNTGATLAAANTFTYDSSKYYSAFFVGTANHYNTLIVKDNYDSVSQSSGKAYVRYINAIPDSSKPKVNITTGHDEVVNGSVPYTTSSDFVAVSPGTLNVAVSNDSTINATRNFPVTQGRAYTVLLVGDPHATDSTKAVQIRYVTN